MSHQTLVTSSSSTKLKPPPPIKQIYSFPPSSSISLKELEKNAQESYLHAIKKLDGEISAKLDSSSASSTTSTAAGFTTIPKPMNPADFSQESNLFLRYVSEIKRMKIFDLYTNTDDEGADHHNSDQIKRLWYEFVINFNHGTLPSIEDFLARQQYREHQLQQQQSSEENNNNSNKNKTVTIIEVEKFVADWYTTVDMKPQNEKKPVTVRKEVSGWQAREPNPSITAGHTNNNSSTTDFDWGMKLSREQKDAGKSAMDDSSYVGQFVKMEQFVVVGPSAGSMKGYY